MNITRWQLAITPLSPVHMGTGADYDPTSYVIEDGALHAFDALAALSVLSEPSRRELDRILGGRATQSMLLQVQKFFYSNKEALKAVASHHVQISPTMEGFYTSRLGRVAQHETGGKKVQNKLEIERTAWNPATQQAILPGSGLKGAMRTALLNAINAGSSLKKVWNEREKKEQKENNQQLQNRLFQFTARNMELDPLRLMRIGDASLKEPETFATQVRFALNRKKAPVTDAHGNLRQSRAEEAGLYQLLECLPGLIPRAFTTSLDFQNEQGMPRDKWPSMEFNLRNLASACNAFYGNRLNKEMKLLQERNYLDREWTGRLSQLLSSPHIKTAMKENRAFLLRVGRHSGAESVTLEGLRSIKIMKGRDNAPDYLGEAKTLWLAGDERNLHTGMQPFGWLLVEAFKEGETLPTLSSEIANTSIAQWKKQLSQQQQTARNRLPAQQPATPRPTETTQPKPIEAPEPQAPEPKTESERQLLQLKTGLQPYLDRTIALLKDDYGQLVGLFTKYADLAKSWARDDQAREQLARLMEETFDHCGWYQPGTDKKKREKQETKKRDQIKALREGN